MIASILCALAKPLTALRYKVSIEGNISPTLGGRRGGILFLPNHPGLIDPVLVRLQLQNPFEPWVLADKDRISGKATAWIARHFKTMPLPDPAVYGEAAKGKVEETLEACAEVLKRGENLMLYPAGHLMRSHLEDLGASSAVEALLKKAPGTRIVLIRTTGLWGSASSRIHGVSPQMGAFLGMGIRKLLANALFFLPKRPVRITLKEAVDFPYQGTREQQNRYMEAFYNLEAPAGRYVPYGFWENREGGEMPDPIPPKIVGDPAKVDVAIRQRVLDFLKDLSGCPELQDGHQLARDLSLDSLGRLEIINWLSQEYRVEASDPEALGSVGDVILAAAGLLDTSGQRQLKPIDPRWFAPRRVPVSLPEGANLAQAFLNRAKREPDAAILADQSSGVKSYRDIILGILALRPTLKAIEGQYVGIMLPASVGAAILYMTALFAGKTPVMVNWTVGPRNLKHGLDLLKVTKVLSARQLVTRLEAQGMDLSSLQDRFLLLEDVGKTLSLGRKILALLQSRLWWGGLRRAKVTDTAVVLFTSGSENLPKAVPLSQGNLLANIHDLISAYPFLDGHRFTGILPPFHSYGLNTTTILPLCAGVPTVFHPNPTEGAALAAIIQAYGASFLLGTPTFLNGAVRAATDEQLASLKFVITGGEKCPESLYATLDQRFPEMIILEGYGITECSPVVSGNRKDNRRHGTIGLPMPSLRHVLVDPETGERAEPGRPGMLLVQGPSVFSGYLDYEGPSPFQDFEGSAWYRTGDLVKEEDGHLVFAGRLKRFVKLGGEMVSLPAVEEALIARFGHEDDEEIILAVEATPDEHNPELVLFTIRDISREAANAAIREAGLSPIHNIRRVEKVDKIPTLGTGKTDYRSLKARL
ncbi:AMP-binding protein [Holophaga foetida]|uniref:AMP-binding protein n=1 Tax=Holophaga foetida TaxID=35839 RepID=UPI0002474971|nr:AMP-binding protein [Holophaga foetida]